MADKWHCETEEVVLARLGSSPEGLYEGEVTLSLQHFVVYAPEEAR